MKEKPYFYGEMNSSDIMDKTFDFYRIKLSAHIRVTFIAFICTLVILGTVLYVGIGIITPAISKLSYNYLLTSMSSFVGVAVFTVILIVFFSLYMKAVNTIVFNDTIYDRQTSIKDVFLNSIVSMPRVLSVMLAQVLIIVPLAFVLTIIFFMINSMTRFTLAIVGFVSEFKVTPQLIIYFAGIFVVFSILYIVNLLLSFSIPAAIIEKKNFFGALKRSISLFVSKDTFLQSIGLQILSGIIYFILFLFWICIMTFLIKTPVVSINQMLYNIVFLGIRALIAMILSTVLIPVHPILRALLYIKCRSVSEDFDIELAIGRLNGGITK